MRILVMSDTHGHFDVINHYAKEHQIDMVLHCGDFSFLNYDNLSEYPDRELSLKIKHWNDVPLDIRKSVWDLTREEKINLCKEYQVLGNLNQYIEGTKSFEVPVYCIWGNHEDFSLVRKFLASELTIPNFQLVTSEGIDLHENLRVFGVGGNFSLQKFFKEPYDDKFYPFMSYEEWVRVVSNVKKAKKASKTVWMMTHVSPGKEPLLEHFSTKIKAQAWFSGHMGASLPQQYSMFTLNDDADFRSRIELHVEYAKEKWIEFRKRAEDFVHIQELDPNMPQSEFAQEFNVEEKSLQFYYKYYQQLIHNPKVKLQYPEKAILSMLKSGDHLFNINIDSEPITKENYFIRKRAAIVKGTTFINLPDMPDGYTVLESEDAKHFTIRSYGYIG